MSRSRKGSRQGRRASGASRALKSEAQGVEAAVPESGETTGEVSEAGVQPVRRRFSTRRFLIGFGVVMVLAVGGVVGWTWYNINKTLPTINGTVRLAGLSAPVTVTRDGYGVPHIVGESVGDLYAAQGYAHAQDRLFQMWLFRTAGQGRLSESFGEAAVEADRFYRTVGF